MSIKPRHRIATRVRFLLNLKSHEWAARGARARSATWKTTDLARSIPHGERSLLYFLW